MYKLAREGEKDKDEDFEKVKDFFFFSSSQVELKEYLIVLIIFLLYISIFHPFSLTFSNTPADFITVPLRQLYINDYLSMCLPALL